MKGRLISVIAFALLAAMGSSTVLYKIIANSASGRVKAATVRIPVAARDLEPGALVAEADLVDVEWPAAAGSDWVRKRQDIVGRSVTAAIAKDEPFSARRIAENGAGSAFASRIPAGMRAVAVHVDELTGLSRFITPGTHVDVISTPSSTQNGQAGAKTILQNVTVFSMGESVERNQKDRPVAAQSVNLLVTPEQAEVLSQAVAQTRIELILRNPLDTSSVTAAVVAATKLPIIGDAVPKPRLANLFKLPTAVTAAPPAPIAPAQPAKPELPTIEVIHGSKKAVTTVAPSDSQEQK